jgi:hypothetical protein
MAITKEDVADAVRAWFQVWHTRDIETILAMEARAVGFGFRPWAWRDYGARGEGYYRQAMERFSGQKEAYSLVPEDFETSVVGEVGLAWGTFLERCRIPGTRLNRRRSASPSCSLGERPAGRWCCTTATSSLLLPIGSTPRPHGECTHQLRELFCPPPDVS